jgi:hypothetical protein
MRAKTVRLTSAITLALVKPDVALFTGIAS